MADSRGYSHRLVKANKEADAALPGVQLGKLCISQDIPVIAVAEFFGVSRMTIYKWFRGQEMPRKKKLEKIEEVLKKLNSKVHLD